MRGHRRERAAGGENGQFERCAKMAVRERAQWFAQSDAAVPPTLPLNFSTIFSGTRGRCVSSSTGAILRSSVKQVAG